MNMQVFIYLNNFQCSFMVLHKMEEMEIPRTHRKKVYIHILTVQESSIS